MSNDIKHVGIISTIGDLDVSDLTRAAAALQKQVTRDLGPIWGINATVSAFVKLEDMPVGHWPIIIQKNLKEFPGAQGIHLDKNGQPFALVAVSEEWVLTVSHELCEMLVDPFGNRLIPSNSIDPGNPGRVEYLVEVSDPSEAAEFGYSINNLLVSDFYTPNFFDPIKSSGVRYSFTGAIKEPLQVLDGGYLTWHDPDSDHWWQKRMFGQEEIEDLGIMNANVRSIRAEIDRITTPLQKVATSAAKRPQVMLTAASRLTTSLKSSKSKADHWQETIKEIMENSQKQQIFAFSNVKSK